ncbi:CRISPR-associated protein Csm7 [Methylomarinum sp. Ch1-1]|uniref:CRISPR system Cms protein Csm4 n=1 Tax=Methylomarinum roseum TaxID=3067653 RepID=A0AAU7NQ16_9GAMM|nr:CRISPR-associated protein Csm7 [Methylomarinum sp. Ch1-1]MDP4521014.1 CRISPR-associated protein Csm7 [Methylomarinum sp. Ch1-1]
MQSFCVTLRPLSAFATPLKGDTLFGQLCWAIRNRLGEAYLTELLDGYTDGKPFAVVSDAFPEHYLPLPKLPGSFYQAIAGEDRKAVKKRCWLPETEIEKPVSEWLGLARNASELAGEYSKLSEKHPQSHNTIDRRTNTTGEGGFAPYSIEQEWFIPGLKWSFYLVLDSGRLSAEDCEQCLADIGNIGFGRDASIGLGKFAVEDFQARPLPTQDNANACLTLAPCAPQGLGFDGRLSFYQLFTRFGRHGDIAVHQEGKPFKNPVLLAQTAAVFGTNPPESGFIGQGIGGNGELSKTLSATVHQGYAPVIAINVNSKECS